MSVSKVWREFDRNKFQLTAWICSEAEKKFEKLLLIEICWNKGLKDSLKITGIKFYNTMRLMELSCLERYYFCIILTFTKHNKSQKLKVLTSKDSIKGPKVFCPWTNSPLGHQSFLKREVLLLNHFYQTLQILEIKCPTLQGIELRLEQQ